MTRKRPDIQPCGVRHASYVDCEGCWPIPPEIPERLQGPEVGTRVHYANPRYPEFEGDGVVTQRSYVWAPHDPAYRGGSRRYDWKVIRFDSGQTMFVNDWELTVLGDEEPRFDPDGWHESTDAERIAYRGLEW